MIDEIERYIAELEGNEDNVRFKRLLRICEKVFGEYRIRGSHHIFKTPWPMDPRVNLQRGKGGKAKRYQVRQVLKALKKRRTQLK